MPLPISRKDRRQGYQPRREMPSSMTMTMEKEWRGGVKPSAVEEGKKRRFDPGRSVNIPWRRKKTLLWSDGKKASPCDHPKKSEKTDAEKGTPPSR